MAESGDEVKQLCDKDTVNKAESHTTLPPEEDEQPDTEDFQKNCPDVQREYRCTAEWKTQGQGEERHSKSIKGPGLETMLAKIKSREDKKTKANKGDQAENQVKEEEVAKDPVARHVSQCEKPDSAEERDMNEDEKENHHAEERNQGRVKAENGECSNKKEESEEEDEDTARKQTEKSPEPEEEPVGCEPVIKREITEDCLQKKLRRKSLVLKHIKNQQTSTSSRWKNKMYYILRTGNTLDSHTGFLKRLHKNFRRLKQVDGAENGDSILKKCDFILVFCPVVSRAWTNIEAALRQLNTISDTKHAALIVLHCTNDPEYVVPDSSRAVARENTVTVDCLFHEDDGFYKCPKNDAALKTVTGWIKKKPWMN